MPYTKPLQRTNVNSILLCLILSFFGFASKAQITKGGYLGYKNEIGFDFFNAIYNEYGVEYKRFINHSVALHVNPAVITYGGDIFGSASAGNDIGNFERRSIAVNVGFIANYYQNTGMPLPVGYYLGYSFGKEFGEVINTYTSGTFDVSPGTYSYSHNGNLVLMNVGRGVHLFENVVLDINLNFNISWGRLTPNSSASASVVPYLSKKIIAQNRSMDFGVQGGAYRYVTFYTYPKIKLSLLF